MTDGYKRLTINVAVDVHDELVRLADEQGCDITELIKRSVALNKFVWEHRSGQLLTRDGDDVKQVVLTTEAAGVAAGPQATPRVLAEDITVLPVLQTGGSIVHLWVDTRPGTRVRVVAVPTRTSRDRLPEANDV